MASDAMVLGAVESSNLAPREKSHLRKWYDEMNGSGAITRVKHHATSAAEAIRGGGEGLIIGGIMGVLDAELKNGLDLPVQNGWVIPMDGVTAVLALLGSCTTGPHEFVGTDMRNVGIALAGITGYRKTKEFYEMKKAQAGGKSPITQAASAIAGEIGLGKKTRVAGEFGRAKVHGDVGEDPVIAVARKL